MNAQELVAVLANQRRTVLLGGMAVILHGLNRSNQGYRYLDGPAPRRGCAVRKPHESSLSRLAAADDVASALSLDMAKWWKPTGDAYFGRVKREQIIAALSNAAVTAQEIEALKTKKKAELVEEAEKRLASTDWLPEILRRRR